MAESIHLLNNSDTTKATTHETNTHHDQRSIIFVGEIGAGKSSFGNFILRRNRFPTGDSMLSTTQNMDCESFLYTEDNANIQLHLFDLPGLNDPRLIDTTHLTNAYNGLKQSAKSMCNVFAITIDPSVEDELEQGVNTVLKFLSKCKFPDLDIIENAIVVFTHADKLGKTLNEQMNNLYSIINKSHNLHKLLTAVRSRLMLVNVLDYNDQQYWQRILGELIEFCIPKFNVLLIGPHNSAKNDLIELMNTQIGDYITHHDLTPNTNTNLDNLSIVYENKHLLLDSINMDDTNAMKRITTTLSMPGTISSFCILIQCSNKLKNTFFDSIDNLANSLTDNNPDLFYECSFILFLHNNDENIQDTVNSAMNRIEELKILLARISNRYIIFNCSSSITLPINNITSCLETFFEMSKKIKQTFYGDKNHEELLGSTSADDANQTLNKYQNRGILGAAISGNALVTFGLGAVALGTVGVVLTAPVLSVVAPLVLAAAPVATKLILAGSLVSKSALAVGVGVTGVGVVNNAISICSQFYNKLMQGEENENRTQMQMQMSVKMTLILNRF